MTRPEDYKRVRRHEIPRGVRLLTFTCYHSLPLFHNDRIKQVFVDRLCIVREEHRFQLISWVVMPEHVHMLIVPDVQFSPVSRIMHALKRPIAEQVIQRWAKLDAGILDRITDSAGTRRFWQAGGGHDRNPRAEEGIASAVGYIHRNPVRRGLVKDAVDWPWSSARWYAGVEDGPIEIDLEPRLKRSRDWLKHMRDEGWV